MFEVLSNNEILSSRVSFADFYSAAHTLLSSGIQAYLRECRSNFKSIPCFINNKADVPSLKIQAAILTIFVPAGSIITVFFQINWLKLSLLFCVKPPTRSRSSSLIIYINDRQTKHEQLLTIPEADPSTPDLERTPFKGYISETIIRIDMKIWHIILRCCRNYEAKKN